MIQTFRDQVTIAFDEADPGGILFYGRFLNLSHRTIESFVRHRGIPWEDWYRHPKWAVPIRHIKADYLRPLFAGKTYDITLDLLGLGESSVKFKTIFWKQDQPCAVIESTHVFIMIDTLKKIPIPEDIRAKLCD